MNGFNGCWWIIILILILGCGGCGNYGCGNSCGCNNNCGCGCNNNCGSNCGCGCNGTSVC